MGKKKGQSPAEQQADFRRKIKITVITIAALTVVTAIVLTILKFTIWSTHGSAREVSRVACESIYGCNYDAFTDATVYNEDCMVALGLELRGELQNSIKQQFDSTKQLLEEAGVTYRAKKSHAEEYKPGSDRFQTGIEMLLSDYPEADTSKIEMVGYAEVEVEGTFRDESGTYRETETEEYWSYRIDGKWYANPPRYSVVE